MSDPQPNLGAIDGLRLPIEVDGWLLQEEDLLLFALLTDPVYMPELLWKDPGNRKYGTCYRIRDYQYQMNRCEENFAIFACGRSVGKALTLDTPVLTPDGWILLGDLEEGMEVIGADGKPTAVTGVFDQGKRPVYEVTFNDGTRISCDDEHLWYVTCDGWESRKRKGWNSGARVLSLKEIRKRKATFKVPLVEPVEFASLPEPEISPWLVGVLLGDGSFRAQSDVRLSSADKEIVDRVRKEMPSDVELVYDSQYDYRFRARVLQRRGKDPLPTSLLSWSRKVGLQQKLSHEKHVPEEYLWGSIETRLALLQGLVDTDGSICLPGGSVEICTASGQMAEDVRHIVLSLGGRVTVTQAEAWCKGKRHRDRYRIVFHLPDFDPCWLPRKLERFKQAQSRRTKQSSWRVIRRIERKRKHEDMRCISVAASDGLFVIDQFVITHNTESEKVHAQVHGIKSESESLLITAPELIHLLPVTDAIEDNIRGSRLLENSLDTNNGRTGFTHRPFGVNYKDGTKVVGRIPKLTGTGVKGQHQPFLIVEEGQDYPEKGWSEVEEAQPIDALVLTPIGFRPMGDIQPGDYVIGSNGKPTLVEGIAEQGLRPVLSVEFSDGSVVECDEEHLWTVICNRHRPKDNWRTIRAKEIEEHVSKDGGFGSHRQPWSVPRIKGPVEFARGDPLRLDPYLLGLLLGDGGMTTGSVRFATEDPELVAAVRARLDPEEELVYEGRCDYRVRGRSRRNGVRVPLNAKLRALGLWGKGAHEKSIPREYLVASVGDRLALLQGLVDTDGSIHKNGAVHFDTTSPQLHQDVKELVWSLGGKLSQNTMKKKKYRDLHRILFRLTDAHVPCRLSRKCGLLRPSSVDKLQRRIVGVTRGPEKEMKCIKVAAPDGLYVTNDYVMTHNTVNFDAIDKDGKPRYRFWVYGVHSGNRKSGFAERAGSAQWKTIQVTRLMRPDWNKEAKERAKAAYGGTSSGDYRRNILGEPGDAASAYFVTARLMSVVDQNIERGDPNDPKDYQKGSDYNTTEYVHQLFRAEELDDMGLTIGQALDLPAGYQSVYGGVDVGLNRSPTVISLFTETLVAERNGKQKLRLKLFRRFTLERFRSKQIRQALYAIDMHYGGSLMQIGVDSTGLGLPIMQEIEDDEICPPHLMEVIRGYFFGGKVTVAVAPEHVYKDDRGVMRDQYGAMVQEERLPNGTVRFIVSAPFITASTRYLSEWVDSGFLLLPFDKEITTDMLGETKERVERLQNANEGGNPIRKPDIFHILDSFRAMAMAYHATGIEEQLAVPAQRPVLDLLM